MMINRETNDGKKNKNITDGVNDDLMATRKVEHDTESVHIMVALPNHKRLGKVPLGDYYCSGPF